jgi:hypothetical protein
MEIRKNKTTKKTKHKKNNRKTISQNTERTKTLIVKIRNANEK